MQNVNLNLDLRRASYPFLFICSALALTVSIRPQGSVALVNDSLKALSQSPSIAATRGTYNGKLVFRSNRQNDGGIKLWTMNPDGSNPTQLTFESDRSPNLPSYTFVYDVGPKWSPDGTRIAFASDRDYDSAEPYTIYIMDYPSRNVQRVTLNQLAALCPGVG